MIVRCVDSMFQTDVLIEGWEYEVRAERDDCYILSGFDKGFSKRRFEIVSQPTIEFSGRVAAAGGRGARRCRADQRTDAAGPKTGSPSVQALLCPPAPPPVVQPPAPSNVLSR